MRARGIALFSCLLAAPASASAQLRPLDPLDWHTLDAGGTVAAEMGAGFYGDQRLSRPGTEGTLREYLTFRLGWRTERTLLEVAGAARRTFRDDGSFAPPVPGVAPGPERGDVGDVRVSTTVRLSPEHRPLALALRFGTRLPTTDDAVGLERDRTDFFALLGGRLHRGPLRLAGEAGVGIHGTLDEEFDQADVLLYALAVDYRLGPLTPVAALVGQVDGFDGFSVRGNEDLAELRLGLATGERRWARIEWIFGRTEFSPRAGLRLTAGIRR